MTNRLLPKAAALAAAMFASCSGQQTPARVEAIDSALCYHRTTYPKARLADVYKSFYQDAFGPGHILADTARSRAYLMAELADTAAAWGGPVMEPTGADGNFYRVNLSLVRDGKVTADEYFAAFVGSLESASLPEPSAWPATWATVDSLIARHGWHYEQEDSDRQMIAERLASGNYTVHHSDEFNSEYGFHYRIIAADRIPARWFDMR